MFLSVGRFFRSGSKVRDKGAPKPFWMHLAPDINGRNFRPADMRTLRDISVTHCDAAEDAKTRYWIG